MNIVNPKLFKNGMIGSKLQPCKQQMAYFSEITGTVAKALITIH